jgi:hypothetical protein
MCTSRNNYDQAVAEAGAILGIQVLDNVIVVRNGTARSESWACYDNQPWVADYSQFAAFSCVALTSILHERQKCRRNVIRLCRQQLRIPVGGDWDEIIGKMSGSVCVEITSVTYGDNDPATLSENQDGWGAPPQNPLKG